MNQIDDLTHYIIKWNLQEHLNPDLLRNLQLVRMRAAHEFTIQDDDEAKLYILVAGSVHVRYDHLNGKQSQVGTVTPLAMLGDLDLFYRPNLALTIVAEEASVLLWLDRAVALRYGRDDPRFLRFVIENLAAKLTASTAILKHNVLPLTGQVASYLVHHIDDTNLSITIHSKTYLAELMGTTPRHLNRVLNDLIDEKIISIDATQITIQNKEALIRFAET